jgi:hypothetical protein
MLGGHHSGLCKTVGTFVVKAEQQLEDILDAESDENE